MANSWDGLWEIFASNCQRVRHLTLFSGYTGCLPHQSSTLQRYQCSHKTAVQLWSQSHLWLTQSISTEEWGLFICLFVGLHIKSKSTLYSTASTRVCFVLFCVVISFLLRYKVSCYFSVRPSSQVQEQLGARSDVPRLVSKSSLEDYFSVSQ